jgi:hypothetical protein
MRQKSLSSCWIGKVYECNERFLRRNGLNIRKSSCYLYDDPVNGGTGLCSVSFNGTTKVEVLVTPDSGLITGSGRCFTLAMERRRITQPHYSDEIYSLRFQRQSYSLTPASPARFENYACIWCSAGY